MNGLCRRLILHLMYFGRWMWIAKVFEHIKPTLIFGQGVLITTYIIWWKDSNFLLCLRGLVEFVLWAGVWHYTRVHCYSTLFTRHSSSFIQPLTLFYPTTAVERSEAIARQADVIAAMSLEVLKGTSRAFDSSEWPPLSINSCCCL